MLSADIISITALQSVRETQRPDEEAGGDSDERRNTVVLHVMSPSHLHWLVSMLSSSHGPMMLQTGLPH